MKRLTEKYIKNIVKKALREEIMKYDSEKDYDDYEEEEPDYFMEYVNGYPNEDFSPSDITADDLIDYCHTIGDVSYIIDWFKGLNICTASNRDIKVIVNDLFDCSLTLTHEVDWLIEDKFDFEHEYIAVFNIKTDHSNYYLVYEQPK